MKKFITFTLLSLIALTLTACGEDYIPFGEYRIEWDKHDPKIHGQVVHFNEPMSYVLLNDEHLGNYTKEEIKIGRLLHSTYYVFMPGGDDKQGYPSEPIPNGMTFTIIKSYWYRRDWLDRSLNGDLHILVFSDETGVQSTSLITNLYDSDKANLIAYAKTSKLK